MKKIKSVNLVFENCDSAIVPINAIGGFAISDIQKEYSICNCNELHEYVYGKHFYMLFEDLKSLKYKDFVDRKKSLHKRITDHEDITHINIVYEDGTNDYIGVPWKTIGRTYRNFFQELKIEKCPNGKKYYVLIINEGWNFRKLIKFLYWKLIKIPYYRLTYKHRIKKLNKVK